MGTIAALFVHEYLVALNTQKTTQRDEDITDKRQHRGTKTLQTKDNTEGRRHYRQKTTQRDEDITDMNKTTQREPEHETGLQNVGLAYL